MNRGKWLKKIVAYVLSICVIVSGLYVTDFSAVHAADGTTVYFLNTDGWTDIKVHGWTDENSNIFGDWPGASAVQANEIGNNWWKIDVPYDAAVQGFSIMFTDNGSETDRTTSYIDNRSDVYLTTVNDAKYSSSSAAETAMGISSGNQDGSTTIYFFNNQGWSNVYGYAYANDTPVAENYPGKQAVLATEKGTNWWKVTVDRNASLAPFNVIFNDGGDSKQANVYITDESNVYVTSDGNKYSTSQAAETAAGGSGSDPESSTEESSTGGVNPDLDYDVDLSGLGAQLPYVIYEAEGASTNAEILPKSTAYLNAIQSEASGRQAVKLTDIGDYVEFTLTKPANAFVVRYSMPDSSDGTGISANLSLYVDGNDSQDITLTSRYAWIYGSYPYSNNPGQGSGHRFFDEARAFLKNGILPAGAKIKLQKDAGDTADYYIIDFMECELVEDALTQPEGSLSITDYGAVANDGQDDATAIGNCIEAAKSQGKEVWIPEGTFELPNKKAFDVSGVTIRGAGMWYSNLNGAGASFNYQGTCKFYDFAMTGVSTVRDDGGDLAGFEGKGFAENVTIQNIWIEHVKVGIWSYSTTGLVVQGCRIRNTYADGINLCSGTNSAVIRNNSLRNTGDDCIAIWPWQADSCNNTIAYNTVQCPTLANGIAVYGGAGNKVEYNYVADSINNGSGICIGTDYDTPNGFTGTTTVSNNALVRCGSYHCDYNYQIGAIWVWATKKPMTATFDVTNNTLYDCSYEGILVDNWNTISGLNITNNNIYGATTDGVYIRGNSGGSVTIENLGVAAYGGELLKNEASNFVVNQTGTGIHETTMPEKPDPEDQTTTISEQQTTTITVTTPETSDIATSVEEATSEGGETIAPSTEEMTSLEEGTTAEDIDITTALETDVTTTPDTGDNPKFNPADLTYTTITCEGLEDLTLGYAIQSTTIEGIAPWYGDNGTTLSIQFSADAGNVLNVTLNEAADVDDIIKEIAPGLVKIDPTKLADDSYTIIEVAAENGEFIFVVKKSANLTPGTNPITTSFEEETSTLADEKVTTEESGETTSEGEEITTVGDGETTTEGEETTTVGDRETTTPSVGGEVTTAPSGKGDTATSVTTVVPTSKSSTGNIFVGKTKVKKLKKKLASQKAKVSLKKIRGAKYQVKISTTKKFKKKKTVSKKKVKKATFTIKNKKLAYKKVLYVKARAYRIVNGKTYYGKWSKVKKIKIKK